MKPVIQRTNKYDLFKRIESNREVNPAHLKKIEKSISEKNFLHLYPIIVNERMEIIDGQHRLSDTLPVDPRHTRVFPAA